MREIDRAMPKNAAELLANPTAGSETERLEAVKILGSHAGDDSIRALHIVAARAQEKSDEYSSVLQAAGKALASFATPAADKVVADLIEEKHVRSPSQSGLMEGLAERIRDGDGAAEPAFGAGAVSAEPNLRYVAVVICRRFPSRLAVPILSAALHDEEKIANEALDIIPDRLIVRSSEIQSKLTAIALGQERVSDEVRIRSIDALARIAKLPEVKTALESLTQNPDSKIRGAALRALEQ